MSEYNIQTAKNAQRNYCESNGFPHFAPENGRCWYCQNNIYELYTTQRRGFFNDLYESKTGITVKEAGESLVTGCPHCSRSYVD